DTEAFEFQQIYNLEVVVIPTHREMVRDDRNDLIYLHEKDKYMAMVQDIKRCVEDNRPVLVGTASIETSEIVSEQLQKEKIPHELLNAKQHEREAHIVAQAGRAGSVTIATNMAGRGTDIVLGGSLDADLEALGEDASPEQIEEVKAAWQKRHDDVIAAGGLHIIGTERHESRRIDNQLRGRAGRQGDPGSSRFYISLEDNLMRIFASDRMRGLMKRLGMDDGEAIENSMVTKSIENAQRKVEAHNFDIRKNLLDYDNVANDQRKVIYQQRNEILEADEVKDQIRGILEDAVAGRFYEFIPPGSIEEQWDVAGLQEALKNDFDLDFPIQTWLDEDSQLHEETLLDKLVDEAEKAYAAKEELYGAELMRQIERDLMLQVVDNHWKEHLAAMDYLRQSIGLRGYAQKDPKQEYKREAFDMFQSLLERIKQDVASVLFRLQIQGEQDLPQHPSEEEIESQMEFSHPEANLLGEGESSSEEAPETAAPFKRDTPKVGRNDPCPCGSGKKYKHCHGKLG
ncbi:MAG TPA: preprotein translocase subunit SecA, partial [Gammaproteobacteria bacterium]|nr:preprotein translocase subunit SecA [Gammaproteobacteria bacterium]